MTSEDKQTFIRLWYLLAKELNDNAHEKGFYDKPRSFGDDIALIHSELSEALEAHRHHNPPSDHIPDFYGVDEEFADAHIRLFEVGFQRDMRVPEAMFAKIEFNSTRPHRHGGKVL